ncbi:hypothetical protein L2E82_31961 [Cichorium intybus]|uniref:Uncharacterized protein n=1 Tax=Cichorium intybus TaxID=13427 RepID=A0ACB9BEZ8_CICIN|nr:hypothetical protein L2E82_31961 [Cichorium intybus]
MEHLDLFRRIVDPDALLSVYVRPVGSTVYPGRNVTDVVIVIGNFSIATLSKELMREDEEKLEPGGEVGKLEPKDFSKRSERVYWILSWNHLQRHQSQHWIFEWLNKATPAASPRFGIHFDMVISVSVTTGIIQMNINFVPLQNLCL